MAKKLVTIDVDDKNLTASAKSVEVKVKKQEKKEIEDFGIVEINNASSAKKVKINTEKGFAKNVSGETKRTVKNKTSMVEDYFDFSFRTNEKAKTEVLKETASKVEVKDTKKVEAKRATTNALKEEQKENVSESVKFDSDANHIMRVARIGSLFDCDIKMMQA